MTIDDVAFRVADALNQIGIAFMLAGGFSSNYHGIPRSTKDADFVIEFSSPLNDSFTRTLGPMFEPEPQLSFETNTGTQRQEFLVKGTMFKVEVFRLSGDAHDQERFRRRLPVDVDGHRIYFPTAEDVIIWKLRWARSKDKDDVRAIMSVQRDKLDWSYIENWCEQHSTKNRLEEIRRTVPDV